MSAPTGIDERAALAYGLAAVLAWSTVATAFKLGLAILAPLQLLLIATVVSTLLFAAVATVTGNWRPGPRVLMEGAWFGLLNPFLYYLVLFAAYQRLPAQIAQPLNYTWAITLALLAVPVLKQPLTRRALGSIGISYLGVLVLLSQGRIDAWPQVDWLGVALALGSTVLWAGYWLSNTRSTVPAVALMAWSFLLATPMVAVACWLGPGLPPLNWQTLGYGAWVGLIEMGITFLLWQQALRRTANAARIGQLIFLAPFLSLVLIGTALGETIHATSVVGLAVILLGLWIARERPRA
ncbi:MAG: DMT family transporter [Pseudomonadales bacterium]